MSRRIYWCAFTLLLIACAAGCARTHYRVRADGDAYCLLAEKTARAPWTPPSNYSVYPDPRSRLFDGSPLDDPRLPIPSPSLYSYDLPELPERDPNRFRPEVGAAEPAQSAVTNTSEVTRLPPVVVDESTDSSPPDGTGSGWTDTEGKTASPTRRATDADPDASPAKLDQKAASSPFTLAMYRRGQSPDQAAPTSDPSPGPELAPSSGDPRDPVDSGFPDVSSEDSRDADDGSTQTAEPDLDQPAGGGGAPSMRQVAIDRSYWEDIPASCLRRMIEFESVQEEYRQSYGERPPEALFDDAPKLALEDIVELTLLNSRQYQTEKENLYNVALGLSLERFDFQLKPSVGGNGIAADYSHDRSGGETINSLRVPSSVQLDKVLVTGGDLLARFANNVLLTFNGPQGFAADIGSDLLFDISQSLLQRDIRLEGLTQAERDVIYAARDFARFRKTLFVDQASQYYSLIRQYRQIEIDSQNYFTLVRQYNQSAAEFRAGLTSRIQLDQIEQQVLNGRRGLITRCVNLEGQLDGLKLRIGLPTEQPINVDLTELNLLTLRDELAVNGELIERVRRRLDSELQAEEPARATLLSASVVLLDRMLESIRLREQLGYRPPDPRQLRERRARLQVAIGRLGVDESLQELRNELNADAPDVLTVFQRRIDVIRELLRLFEFQLQLAEVLSQPADRIEELRGRLQQQTRQLTDALDRLQQLIAEEQLDQLPQLVDDVQQLQQDIEAAVRATAELIGITDQNLSEQEQLADTVEQVNSLLRESQEFLGAAEGGLVPVEIDMDNAMLTALVSRFDVINQRGTLADQRRQIKLAADDLKSVLNLQATQAIRTRADVNRPFDFTFDESSTRLNLSFDAPFNRRAQRNSYRRSIINYQRALRQLTELEDTIKLSVRDDLRALTLDQEQYVIDVASAALAFERVVSTELELRLGIGSVIARDFLESQLAYVQAVSGVASQHIQYIVDRTQLFLDLELLTVGEDGFWPQLYEEQYQPSPRYQLPAYARPAYGRLHPRLKYSHRMRRLLNVPTGTSGIHAPADDAADQRRDPTPRQEELPAPPAK